MGKFTNLILLAAAAALILIGVAAQTGAVSFANHSRHSSAVMGQTARQPLPSNPPYIDAAPSPDTSQPTTDQNPQPIFATEDSGHGHGEGEGNGHGHGDGG